MKPVLLMNDVYTNKMNSHEKNKTRSTLRIPVNLIEEFEHKIEEHKTVNNYFHYLLKRFRLFNYSGMIPDAEKVKTLYQESGLGYERVDFEPRNEDWIEIGALALAFGKSRCWMFTFLLKLDIAGFGEILPLAGLGTPSLAGCFLFTGTLSRQRTSSFTRAMQIKPDYFGSGAIKNSKLYGLQLNKK